jgi:hypothetical protein
MCQEYQEKSRRNDKKRSIQLFPIRLFFLYLIYILLYFTFYLFAFFVWCLLLIYRASGQQWSGEKKLCSFCGYCLESPQRLRIIVYLVHFSGRRKFSVISISRSNSNSAKSLLIGCFVTKWTLNTVFFSFFFLFTILCLASSYKSIKINYAEFGGRLNTLK